MIGTSVLINAAVQTKRWSGRRSWFYIKSSWCITEYFARINCTKRNENLVVEWAHFQKNKQLSKSVCEVPLLRNEDYRTLPFCTATADVIAECNDVMRMAILLCHATFWMTIVYKKIYKNKKIKFEGVHRCCLRYSLKTLRFGSMKP
jgi:hypothetical protein